MAYKLYRDVKLLSVSKEVVERTLRPKEIADPSFRRGNYEVTVARFSNVDYEVTVADFVQELSTGQTFSIAVNDQFQLIALINHSTGARRSLKTNGVSFSEIASTLFYLLIPGVLGYAIARKAFNTVQYHNVGWVVIALAGGFILFVLRGVLGQFGESERALKELGGKG